MDLTRITSKFNFYQQIRTLVSRVRSEKKSLQEDLDNKIYITSTLSMAAPEGEIERIEQGTQEDPLQVIVYKNGLTGAMGALPTAYTEWLIERQYRYDDVSAKAFLDIFNHRILCLDYLSWQKNHIYALAESDFQRPFKQATSALSGLLLTPSLFTTDSYAHLFSSPVRSLVNLEAWLSHYYCVPVQITPFTGGWKFVEKIDLCCLGKNHKDLGFAPMIGRARWEIQAHFDVTFGPMEQKTSQHFIPHGKFYHDIWPRIREYVGPGLDFSVHLSISSRDGRVFPLGEGRLGFDICIGENDPSKLRRLCLPIDITGVENSSISLYSRDDIEKISELRSKQLINNKSATATILKDNRIKQLATLNPNYTPGVIDPYFLKHIDTVKRPSFVLRNITDSYVSHVVEVIKNNTVDCTVFYYISTKFKNINNSLKKRICFFKHISYKRITITSILFWGDIDKAKAYPSLKYFFSKTKNETVKLVSMNDKFVDDSSIHNSLTDFLVNVSDRTVISDDEKFSDNYEQGINESKQEITDDSPPLLQTDTKDDSLASEKSLTVLTSEVVISADNIDNVEFTASSIDEYALLKVKEVHDVSMIDNDSYQSSHEERDFDELNQEHSINNNDISDVVIFSEPFNKVGDIDFLPGVSIDSNTLNNDVFIDNGDINVMNVTPNEMIQAWTQYQDDNASASASASALHDKSPGTLSGMSFINTLIEKSIEIINGDLNSEAAYSWGSEMKGALDMVSQENLKEMQKGHFLHWIGPIANDLLLLTLNGKESVSKPFRYELRSLTALNEKNIIKLHGKAVSCQIGTSLENHPLRYINGIITHINQERITKSQTLCTFTVEPAFSLLQMGKSMRVWQNISVPDLVVKLLRKCKVQHVDIRLHGTYEKRDCCIQYRESDFDFISRLLEEEGIYYFFIHNEDHHVLVLADHPTAHPVSKDSNLSFDETGSSKSFGNIHSWSVESSMVPGGIELSGYSVSKATGIIERQKSKLSNQGVNHINVIDSTIFEESKQLAGRVKLMMEAFEVNSKLYQASSNAYWLNCGEVFMLTRHPTDNDHYRIQKLEIKIKNSFNDKPAELKCHLNVLRNNVKWHPICKCSSPEVPGILTAKVVGPGSEDIYTDKLGRVKIQFPWDDEETSSCWVRVSQPWSGQQFGTQFLPRVGHEVLVSFIQGDPNLPLITGSVYNGQNKMPFTMPDGKYESGFVSRSANKGKIEEGNRFSFNDKKGNEKLTIVSQKDFSLTVKNNVISNVEKEYKVKIGTNRYTELSKGNDILSIKEGDFKTTLDKGDFSTKVKKGNYSLSVSGGDCEIKANKSCTIDARQSIKLSVGNSSITVSSSSITISSEVINIKGKKIACIEGELTQISGKQTVLIDGKLINIG